MIPFQYLLAFILFPIFFFSYGFFWTLGQQGAYRFVEKYMPWLVEDDWKPLPDQFAVAEKEVTEK